MIKEYLEIGKITSTHGIRGEVRIEPWCDSPEFLKKFKVLYYDSKGEKPFKIASRPHGHMAIAKIEGVDSIEEASKLRNKVIYMKRSEAKLPKGKYFIAELIDCKVIDGVIALMAQSASQVKWWILGTERKNASWINMFTTWVAVLSVSYV